MKYRSRIALLINLMLVLLILISAGIACWGDVYYSLQIKNHTDDNITVSLGIYPVGRIINLGEVEPGKEIIYRTSVFERYLIDAEIVEGTVIFSKEFSWLELNDMDWEVVITPQEDG